MRFHHLEYGLEQSELHWDQDDPKWKEVHSSLAMLRSSQKFYAGHVDLIPKLPESFAPGDMPRMPYPVLAVEFSLETDDREPMQMIVLCGEHKGEGGVEYCVYWPWVRILPGGWSSNGRVVFRSDNGQAKTLISALIDPIDRDFVTANIYYCVRCAIRFLCVLNCVNVRTEDVAAPAALNKKRAKAGKPPIYSYKTLVLRPTVTARANGGGTHDSPRIHLRRGHIKRRKTGNFWWQPCVVGDRKKGVVMKDYRADKLVEARA